MGNIGSVQYSVSVFSYWVQLEERSCYLAKKNEKMKIKEILSILEEIAPLAYAEDFDNVGLLVGDSTTEAIGILVCHDALESVIDEAITKKCNLVVCFHPIIFSGLK